MDRFSRSNDSIVQRTGTGLQTFMAQVYGWMTVGLLLTAFVALYVASSATLIEMIFTNKIFFFGLIIAQLALVFILSGMVHKMSGALATTLFYALFRINRCHYFECVNCLYLLLCC